MYSLSIPVSTWRTHLVGKDHLRRVLDTHVQRVTLLLQILLVLDYGFDLRQWPQKLSIMLADSGDTTHLAGTLSTSELSLDSIAHIDRLTFFILDILPGGPISFHPGMTAFTYCVQSLYSEIQSMREVRRKRSATGTADGIWDTFHTFFVPRLYSNSLTPPLP